jgi:hypothetical protein
MEFSLSVCRHQQCLVLGVNAKTIANGVVAEVTAILAPDVIGAVIRIGDPLAASAGGYFGPASIISGSRATTRPAENRRKAVSLWQ